MSTASRVMGITFAVLCAAVLCSGFAAVAQAGPLPLDANAMGGTNQGTQLIQNKGGPTTLSVNVEYAVYAPGQFTKTFGAGSDPSGGSQYVYAYEAFNLNTAPLPQDLAIFTVGLRPGANAANVEYLPITFGNYGLLPASSSFGGTPPTSARWDYTGQVVPPNQNSQILLFTSPNAPTKASASVVGGGLAAAHPLPSPVPEPASWALLGIGTAALLYRRLVVARRATNA